MNRLTRTRLNTMVVGLALAVCLAVFSLYTQPAFLQVLANQLWGCL